MRHKRLRRRPARNFIHHGRLHFQKVHLVQVRAHELDDLGAGDEGVAGAAVDDEVEEALAVAGFLVFEAEVLGGELAETGGEELDCLCEDGEFPRLVDVGGACGVGSCTSYISPLDHARGMRHEAMVTYCLGSPRCQ